MPNDNEIRLFRVDVPDEAITDLRGGWHCANPGIAIVVRPVSGTPRAKAVTSSLSGSGTPGMPNGFRLMLLSRNCESRSSPWVRVLRGYQ